MPDLGIPYDQLPGAVKDNLTEEQWRQAQRGVVLPGATVPETTVYMNLRTGCCRQYTVGEAADGPLLPTHDLSGGHGKDSTQFQTAPSGSHGVP